MYSITGIRFFVKRNLQILSLYDTLLVHNFYYNMNLESQNNRPNKAKPSVAEIQAKKASMLQKLGLAVGGLALGLGSTMPAMGMENKGAITPDMQPKSDVIKTQDGAMLQNKTGVITPTTQVQGPETQDGAILTPENIDTSIPQDGPYDDVPDLKRSSTMKSTPIYDEAGNKVGDIGEAWIPKEHPGK
jgi:hypothetical protein